MGRDDLVASAAYQPEPTAAAAARRFVRETLQAWLMTGATSDGHGLIDDAVLLTSELVTNAVVHAGTPVQVTCKLAGGEVEVVVSDCQPAAMVPEPSGSEHGAAERTGGRGLLLPAALASAWGVTYGRAAKAVWFRLGVAGAPGAAGWGNGLGEGLGATLVGEFEAELAGGTALAAAFRSVTAGAGGGTSPDTPQGQDAGITIGSGAGHGYPQLAEATAESARATVGADGACVLLADEDGDLRLQAAAGSMRAQPRPDAAPSVLTAPFVVDGRVTGVLAAVSARPGSFGDPDAAALQRLADSCGPVLQRAWLDEIERVRRDRIAALTDARALLGAGLPREEVMAQTGRAVVPRLAPWCAVLLPDASERLALAYVHHRDAACIMPLTRLIEDACALGPPVPPPVERAGAGQGSGQGGAGQGSGQGGAGQGAGGRGGAGPGWRWRLGDASLSGGDMFPGGAVFPSDAALSGGDGFGDGAVFTGDAPVAAGDAFGDDAVFPGDAPFTAGAAPPDGGTLQGVTVSPGHAVCPGGAAWCFPVGQPWDGQSLLLLGAGRGGRLSREVAALAGDLACRVGLALGRSGGLMPAP